jgi:hypothetical protein
MIGECTSPRPLYISGLKKREGCAGEVATKCDSI